MGLTPLHSAILRKNPELVKLLLDSGADSNINTPVGTPSSMAVQCGNSEILGLLSRSGTQITALSDKLACLVLSFLPPAELFAVRRVCKRFALLCVQLSQEPTYWARFRLVREAFYYHMQTFKEERHTVQLWSGPPPSVEEGSQSFKFNIVIIGGMDVGRVTWAQAFLHKEKGTPTIGRRPSMAPKPQAKMVSGLSALSNVVASEQENRRLLFQTKKITIVPTVPQDHNMTACIKQAHGFILMFDLTAYNTFRDLQQWYVMMRRNREQEQDLPSTVLVGNKADLTAHRVVPFGEVVTFAEAHGLPYVETSGLTGDNVDLAVAALAHTSYRRLLAGDAAILRCVIQARELSASDVRAVLVRGTGRGGRHSRGGCAAGLATSAPAVGVLHAQQQQQSKKTPPRASSEWRLTKRKSSNLLAHFGGQEQQPACPVQ
eukprot:TRINITY_DN478_c0_g1_i3.p1 TRINITY_DN478_c0_g1~~TRINITY_DN478_c0_g1_i3.p1  ORF type:complete len:432 (+),score=98.50 TRINITY_DN478_c0_g1_i3:201-1496(+)